MANEKPPPLFFAHEKLVAFDCDDTLVMWDDSADNYTPDANKLAVVDPYLSAGYTGEPRYVYLTPHKKHIQKLKGYKRTGFTVIVWSMGGLHGQRL